MTVDSLFKYGKLNKHHSKAVFSTPTVWLSTPALLNDPFECQPGFTFGGSQEQIVKFIERGLLQHRPDLTPYNATAQAVSIFLEGRHRNPNTWEGLSLDMLTRYRHKIGLYCLSENNDSILMWSHYADEHRGYCLEFEAADHTPFFGAAQQVNYCTDYPVVDFFNTQKEEKVELIFLTKFVGWSYEKEWRIINHEIGSGIHEYPPELLRGVIFGQRMPEPDRTKIRTWVKKRGYAVKFFEAQLHNHQFKVVVNEIN